MKRIRNYKMKIIIFIVFILIIIIYKNNVSYASYKNEIDTLDERISAFDKNGETGVDTGVIYNNVKGSNTIWKNNSHLYCVTRGNGENDGDTTTSYAISYFVKITSDGVGYQTTRIGAGDYSYKFYKWEEIRDSWEDDSETYIRIMYFILNLSDNYGTCYNSGSTSWIESIHKDKNGNKTISGNYVSQRQYAIWRSIDDFVDVFPNTFIKNEGYNKDEPNGKEQECELLDLARNYAKNGTKITDPVYIWGIQPYGNIAENADFFQSLILAGKKTSNNTPTNPPTVTHKNPSLTIKKQDKDGNPLGNVQFALTKVKGSDSDWKYTAWTDSNGICKFTNIAPGNYYLYETYNGNEGYDLSKQDGYDSNNGRVYIGETGYLKQDMTYTWTSPVVNKKYGKITLQKQDR